MEFLNTIQIQLLLAGALLSWGIWVTVAIFTGREKWSLVNQKLDDLKDLVKQLIGPLQK